MQLAGAGGNFDGIDERRRRLGTETLPFSSQAGSSQVPDSQLTDSIYRRSDPYSADPKSHGEFEEDAVAGSFQPPQFGVKSSHTAKQSQYHDYQELPSGN